MQENKSGTEALKDMIDSTEKLLSVKGARPRKDIFGCLERSEPILEAETDEQVANALNWLIRNYKSLLEQEPVTTVVESFSYANSLLREKRANG